MAENHRSMQKTTAWKKVSLIWGNQEVETGFSGLSGEALELCCSSFLKISFDFYQTYIFTWFKQSNSSPRFTTKKQQFPNHSMSSIFCFILEATAFKSYSCFIWYLTHISKSLLEFSISGIICWFPIRHIRIQFPSSPAHPGTQHSHPHLLDADLA